MTRDTPPGVAQREVEQSLAVADATVRAARETGKPVLMFSNLSTGFHPDVARRLAEGHVPYLQGTRETLRAMQTFVRHASFRRRQREDVAVDSLSPTDLPDWRNKLRRVHRTLSEIEGRRLLAAYGISGPKEAVVATAEACIHAADKTGYPVVLKIHSADVQHKTEIGGVRVNLQDQSAVLAAYHEVMDAARRHHPEARLDGVLIQEMMPSDAVEVILGVLRDPDFGPVVVFGSGGILVELFKDSTLRLPPVTHEEALEMVHATRAATLLRGFRGKPPADVDALVDAIVRVSQLAVDLGDLVAALDINPLMVLPKGQGVCAVDVLVELKP
jgi:acetyltransferase